jgi:hypothetical protein
MAKVTRTLPRISSVFLWGLLPIALSTGLCLYWRDVTLRMMRSDAERLALGRLQAAKGYIRTEHGQPVWYFDKFNSEAASTLSEIRSVMILADSNGNVLEYSSQYQRRRLPFPSPDQIRSEIRHVKSAGSPVFRRIHDQQGTRYVLAVGILKDHSDEHRDYYLSIGSLLNDNYLTIPSVISVVAIAAMGVLFALLPRALRTSTTA